jgi:glycosyltransferase involved in cell wall biosynthesis
MTHTLVAIGCAALAACLFAAAVRLQHGAVRAGSDGESLGTRALARVLRSPRWLAGSSFAVLGSALHITALSLAPLAIVQPIGVLSLVLTVLPGSRARGTGKAVFAVCAGVGGFVVLAALAGSPSAATVQLWPAQFVVVGALVLAAAGMSARGRARCLVLATSAAVLFGLGSALIRAASQDILGHGAIGGGLLLATEAVVLMVTGGWLMHQAYAAGPAGVVIATTTVIDPLTAVAVGLGLYGEALHTNPLLALAQAGFALAAVAGVLVLARSIPDPHDLKEPDMPNLPAPGPRSRILISADTFPPDVNGAAHFADRLARGLAARGYDVHVVCPSDTAKATTRSAGPITVHRVASLGTPFHPTFRICTPRQAGRAIPELFDRLRPDVVHVQSHFSIGRAVLKAARRGGVPAIATNHFMPENLLGYAPIPRVLRDPIARWAWRDLVRVYRQADVVTAPTPRAVELLEANGLPGGALAVSCGIDIDHYAPADSAGPQGESVLFVGRLDKEKNVDDLIRAAATLPGIQADIIGDGACRESLIGLATRLGVLDRVRFHGFVTDEELVRAYRRAAVFCMPGTAELQSLATMEAMAAGLPIVAADAMALPHLARPGVNGFLYPPGDIDRLAACLATLTGNAAIRADMGRASRKIIAGHRIDSTLDTFDGLYRDAIDNRSRSVALAS